MTRAGVCSWFVGLAITLPAAAMADTAYTTTAVNLRAGPDTDYPLVRWVPEGTAVEVFGCLADYRWCDVQAYGDRGWMSAGYLVHPYQNSNVPVVTYGAVIGLPLVGFAFDNYWDDHYRRRPWYGERQRWSNRYRPDYDPPRYRQPPPPPPRYYPRDPRPPQYYPPAVRPPEFRPPGVQRPDRQPYYQGRDDRNYPQQPGYRNPGEMRPPMPAVRPQQGPPPSARPQGPPPGRPQTTQPSPPRQAGMPRLPPGYTETPGGAP